MSEELPGPPSYSEYSSVSAQPPVYTLHNHASLLLAKHTAATLENTLAPTSIEDIPLEVLQKIFVDACTSEGQDPDLAELRQCQNTVWACARVSRTWRSTALEVKALWSLVLDFQRFSLPRLQRLLQLSSPSPINVGHRSAPVNFYRTLSVDQGSTDTTGLLRLLVLNQVRIRQLHVRWEFEGSLEPLSDLFCAFLNNLCEHTQLESLSWEGVGPYDVDLLEHSMRSCSGVPEGLKVVSYIPFSTRAPKDKLRSIIIERSCFTFFNPRLAFAFTHLTEFACDFPRHFETRLAPRLASVEMFKDFLRSTPALRFCSIIYSIYPRPVLPQNDASIVELPHLALMTIGGIDDQEMTALFRLVNLIKCPANCGLEVITAAPLRDDHLCTMIQTKVDLMLSDAPPTQDIKWNFDAPDGRSIVLRNFWGAADVLDWKSGGSDRVHRHLQEIASRYPVLKFSLVGSAISDLDSVGQFLEFFVSSQAPEEVTHLRVSSPSRPTSDIYDPGEPVAAISAIPLLAFGMLHLTTLALNHHAAMLMLTSVDDRLTMSDLGHKCFPVIFPPNIEILILEDCRLSSDPESSILPWLSAFFANRMLAMRRRNRRGLRRLVFKRPHFTEPGVDTAYLKRTFTIYAHSVIVELRRVLDSPEYLTFCRRT